LRFGIGFGFEGLGLDLSLGLVSISPNPKDKASSILIYLPEMLYIQKIFFMTWSQIPVQIQSIWDQILNFFWLWSISSKCISFVDALSFGFGEIETKPKLKSKPRPSNPNPIPNLKHQIQTYTQI
jgi:hypothetical protein